MLRASLLTAACDVTAVDQSAERRSVLGGKQAFSKKLRLKTIVGLSTTY